MNRLLIVSLILYSIINQSSAQEKKAFRIGIDFAPLIIAINQYEISIEYQSPKNKFINPFLRGGYADRKVSGNGCLVGDGINHKRALGWSYKIGNYIPIFKKWSISPIIIYNNYQSSAFDTDLSRDIFIKNQNTWYAGLSLRWDIINKPIWGISINGDDVMPLEKESFLGVECNETKIGAGGPIAILYAKIQFIAYLKF